MAKIADTINFSVRLDWFGVWTVFKIGIAVGIGLAIPIGAVTYVVLTVAR